MKFNIHLHYEISTTTPSLLSLSEFSYNLTVTIRIQYFPVIVTIRFQYFPVIVTSDFKYNVTQNCYQISTTTALSLSGFDVYITVTVRFYNHHMVNTHNALVFPLFSGNRAAAYVLLCLFIYCPTLRDSRPAGALRLRISKEDRFVFLVILFAETMSWNVSRYATFFIAHFSRDLLHAFWHAYEDVTGKFLHSYSLVFSLRKLWYGM